MKPGQTLVLLLMFMAIGITVVTASTIMTISVSQTSSRHETGSAVIQVAESGIEDALMRLLRNPSVSGTTNLPVDDGTATINISGTGPYTIRSSGQIGNIVRIIEVQAGFVDGKLTVTSWQEVFP